MPRLWFALLTLLVTACADAAERPVDGGGLAPDAASDARVVEQQVGAQGGTLALGPIALEVPPGAVSQPTVFRISESTRVPRLPAGATAVSKLYRLEPAQAFGADIRVTLGVDRSRVPARVDTTDGLLLLRAPSGTDDFQIIGGAELDGTQLVGHTREFSDVLVIVFSLAGCALPQPSDCTLTPDPSTGALVGSCSISTPGAGYTATCAGQATTVSCTCSSDVPGAMPVSTGPLSITRLLGGGLAATAHTFFTRCGWPCTPSPDADAGAPDADGGALDATTDAASGDDAGSTGDATAGLDAGPGGTATPIATQLPYPDYLVRIGTQLFATGNGLTRVDLVSGMVVRRSSWNEPQSDRVGFMEVDGTDVYTTSYEDQTGSPLQLMRVPYTAGGFGTPVTLAPNGILAGQSATHVYYALSGVGLYALPKAGGAAQRLSDVPALGAAYGTTDGTSLYVIGADSMLGQLYRIPLAGGPVATLATSAGGPAHLILDGDTFYWAHNVRGEIVRVDRNSGVVTAWTSSQFGIRQLAQDATHVYWTSGDRNQGYTVFKKAKLGNDLPVAIVRDFRDGEPWGVAVDDTSVYWSTSASPGAIYRAPK